VVDFGSDRRLGLLVIGQNQVNERLPIFSFFLVPFGISSASEFCTQNTQNETNPPAKHAKHTKRISHLSAAPSERKNSMAPV